MSLPRMPVNTEITRERIKEIKRLHDARERTVKGLFLIEGVRLLEEAVKEGVAVKEVLYGARLEETGRGSSLLASIRKMRIPAFQVPEKVMESVSETETPQGVLGVARQPERTLNDAIIGKKPLVIAWGLQDPGNLGTIIRSADAGDCGGVITTHGTVDSYNSKVIRATMGSIFRLPVVKADEPEELISVLKRDGYRIVAAASHTKNSYLNADYKTPTAFLIGQEATGLPDDALKSADLKVFIPMREGVESLNAAVSASILIYEAFRQRLSRLP